MNGRKITALLLTLALFLGLFQAALASDDELVIGVTTRATGAFFTDLFGLNATDIKVRELLHDYPTVILQTEGQPMVNPSAIAAHEEIHNEDGSLTYLFQLRKDLKYSDGSAIRAKDYVFSLLLTSSPLMRELGTHPAPLSYLQGHQAYVAGEKVFSGVRLLDRDRFSVTIRAEELPNLRPLLMAQVLPCPSRVIAPGCKVKDDGQGAYLSGKISAESLQKTLLHAKKGYLHNPQVTSGAYKLKKYDAETGTVWLVRNKLFLGNALGQKPRIKRIRIQPITNAQMQEKLEKGEVHLLHQMSHPIHRQNGLLAPERFGYVDYERNGLVAFSAVCEQGLLKEVLLRKALMHLMDREKLIKTSLSDIAHPAKGYYSKHQWLAKGMDETKIQDYPYDIQRAVALLEESGFTLDEKGNQYEAGLRFRKTSEGLEPLSLRLIVPVDNDIALAAAQILREGLTTAGGELQIEEVPFQALLDVLYSKAERSANLIFVGTNFGHGFMPALTYDPALIGVQNTTGIDDQALYAAAVALARAANVDLAREAFLAFQQQWTESLPMLPLYNTVYRDLYNNRLSDYGIEGHRLVDALLGAQFR